MFVMQNMKIRYWQFMLLGAITLACGCAELRREFERPSYWDFQEAAENAERIQHYEVAAENYRAFVAKCEKEGRIVDWAPVFLARVYMNQGYYDRAREVLLKESLIDKSKFYNDAYAEIFRSLGICDLEQGKFDDAIKNLERAMAESDEYAKKHPKDIIGFNLWLIYPELGRCYLYQGQYENSKNKLQEKLDYATRIRALGKDKAIAKNDLGMAFYYAGDDAAAEQLFGDAAGRNAGAFACFTEDLAISLTMLGRIAAHRGENGKALNLWQEALEALRSSTWPESQAKRDRPAFERKVEQADVLYQIGRFQLKQGNLEEAVRAHNEAIRLRVASQTQTHPNHADLMMGLAAISAARGELTSATLQATEALRILDTALVPTHPRIAPELVALASIHLQSGHPDAAVPLFTRLETILQKPLGPWKEDFMDTTAFYAGLLKKAGMPDGAEQLEQLHARQKDRR